MNPKGWHADYERSRYLREVPDDVVAQRLLDLASNVWRTDAAGNVVPVDPDTRLQVLRRIADVTFEQFERSGSPSLNFDEQALREATAAAYRPPLLKTPFRGCSDCFTKFGKRKHIASAFDRGIIRIAPASWYVADSSLNAAQADNELEHAAVTANQHLKFKLYGKDAIGTEAEVPVQKKELFRYMMVPDFYVWCCGLDYDARLFHEFKAEAVLVVRDQDAFRTRLAAAVARELPNICMKEDRIRYYDPYTVQREQLIPIFSKHIRYLYQNEYRFAWMVPQGESLKPFFVELGSLHDIGEFLELA